MFFKKMKKKRKKSLVRQLLFILIIVKKVKLVRGRFNFFVLRFMGRSWGDFQRQVVQFFCQLVEGLLRSFWGLWRGSFQERFVYLLFMKEEGVSVLRKGMFYSKRVVFQVLILFVLVRVRFLRNKKRWEGKVVWFRLWLV